MVVCIGEALVDLIDGVAYPGGCPLNTAIAASRLGVRVMLLDRISVDKYGQILAQKIKNNSIIVPLSFLNDKRSTMYSEVILDASGQARYRFRTERTATLGLDAKSLEDELEKEENVEAILFGSVSLMLEPAASSIFRAVSEYKKKHPRVTIFLDPNIRSSLITEFNKYRVWMKDVVKLADIVKMSDEDLLLLTGKPYDQGVREFKTINQCDLIITRGAKGSEWHRGRKVFKAQAANIRIVDTIGAGDTFNGVLLWGLHSLGGLPQKFTDDECKKLLAIATHAADIDCTRRGCNPPTKEELFES